MDSPPPTLLQNSQQPANDFVEKLMRSITTELKDADMLGSISDQVISFFKAINWNQTWIFAVLGFHVVCFLTAICLRNQHTAISIYFFILLAFALLSQPLNDIGMKHWQVFSNEKYFDKSGIFIVFVYSFPVIFNAFVTLAFILKASATLLVQTKIRQLKQQQRNNSNSKRIKSKMS